MAASLRGNYEGGEGRVVEIHRKGRVVIKNDVDVEREREREPWGVSRCLIDL